MVPPFHFDADPDPAFHIDADLDPAFHFDAGSNFPKLRRSMRIRKQEKFT
jgi:hypothetical protein